jgi:hypothetical protein
VYQRFKMNGTYMLQMSQSISQVFQFSPANQYLMLKTSETPENTPNVPALTAL